MELVAGKVWALPKPQRLVAAAAVLARVHASRVRDHDHTHRARTYCNSGPREPLRYLPTRKPVNEDAVLRHLALDGKEGPAARGLDTVARDHPSSNLMPRTGRAGCSLKRPGKPKERKPGPAWGNPDGPVAGT